MPINYSCRPATSTVRADLIGNDVCMGTGLTVRSTAPVLALCRALLAAGMNPDQALKVYRSGMLALTVRSIGEGAELEINSKGTDFVPAARCARARRCVLVRSSLARWGALDERHREHVRRWGDRRDRDPERHRGDRVQLRQLVDGPGHRPARPGD